MKCRRLRICAPHFTSLGMSDLESLWRSAYQHPNPWDTTFASLTIPDMLDTSIAKTPNAPIADFMGARISYSQLGIWVDRFAAALQNLGIGKGDRVGLFLPNVPDYLIAYYGALKMGAIVVNMSPLYTVDELSEQLADSGTRIIVTVDVPQLYNSAHSLLRQCVIDRMIVGSLSGWLPPLKRSLFRLFKRSDIAIVPHGDPKIISLMAMISTAPAKPTPVAIDPTRDVALIQYTGGTTGMPKGAMLTHQNLTANARQVDSIDPKIEAGDRIVGALPFFHVFANTCVLNRTILAGGMIAMLPRFEAGAVLKTIARVKATALPGVPTMYQALLDHPDVGKTDFSSLRFCISGGAPLPAEVKARFEATTGATVIEGYGLTESSGVLTSNPYIGCNKSGTIGQPVPGTRIMLVDREDPTKPPPEGEPGEIVFTGPQAMQGYWGRPESGTENFVGGAVRTGDVGLIDEDGYVRIVDRLKDMIAVGGFKVFPSTIEKRLYANDAVKEALVIGIPDAYSGEKPKAFVTLNEGASINGDELMSWLNPQLGKHERVAAVEIRDALPKTLVGKLSRKELVAEERAKVASA
jgi:long-chain acyl-CoA synthetase